MIAIPVKKDQADTAVAPLYGKAKWFALIDHDRNISFWKNEHLNGRHVTEYFISQGVKKVALQHVGVQPFMMLDGANIACYSAGTERVLLETTLAKLEHDNLSQITTDNMSDYVEQGHHKHHTKGKGHKHGHEHHRHNHHHL